MLFNQLNSVNRRRRGQLDANQGAEMSTKFISWKLFLASLCICAWAMSGAAGASAEPNSMSEAEAIDDPAASAPTVVTPSVFIYEGEQISEDQVQALGLACLQGKTQFTCKNSTSDFDAESESVAARRGGKATASFACGVVALWLYQNIQYGGNSVGNVNFGAWFDVPPIMNNETTSYRTGEASAHLSDFSGGGGYWYPGDTSFCAYHSNINQVYPGWDNRISSRYRY